MGMILGQDKVGIRDKDFLMNLQNLEENMRKIILLAVILSFCLVPVASGEPMITPPINFEPIPIEDIFIPDLPILTARLTVHIEGSGDVMSSPPGMDCSAGPEDLDETCTADFPLGTVIALTADPTDGEEFTSHFLEWAGDCSGSGACPLVMNGAREVTARFGALGEPVFALPVPSGQHSFGYHPVETPHKVPDPNLNKPIALGAGYFSDSLNLQVGLPPFGGDIDVYLAVQPPGSPEPLLINPDETLTPVSSGLVAWKEDIGFMNIDEMLFGAIPPSVLTSGTYQLYIMVTPADSVSDFYLWQTYFYVSTE